MSCSDLTIPKLGCCSSIAVVWVRVSISIFDSDRTSQEQADQVELDFNRIIEIIEDIDIRSISSRAVRFGVIGIDANFVRNQRVYTEPIEPIDADTWFSSYYIEPNVVLPVAPESYSRTTFSHGRGLSFNSFLGLGRVFIPDPEVLTCLVQRERRVTGNPTGEPTIEYDRTIRCDTELFSGEVSRPPPGRMQVDQTLRSYEDFNSIQVFQSRLIVSEINPNIFIEPPDCCNLMP